MVEEKKKPTSPLSVEVLFELRVVRANGKINIEWKIPKPDLRKMAEVFGHLEVIREQIREDLGLEWLGSPGEPAGSRTKDLSYIE